MNKCYEFNMKKYNIYKYINIVMLEKFDVLLYVQYYFMVISVKVRDLLIY